MRLVPCFGCRLPSPEEYAGKPAVSFKSLDRYL
jgi:hypothetical protein